MSSPFQFGSVTYNLSDWVAYTPGFTGLGTVTSISALSRRTGTNLDVWGKATSGTVTATNMQISVGFNGTNANVTVDTSRVPTAVPVGIMTVAGANTTTFGWYILAPTSNQTFVNASVQTSTANATVAQAANAMIANNQLFQFYFSVPIVGWTP